MFCFGFLYKFDVTQYSRLTVYMFCFGFLYKFDVCMIEKKLLYCLFVYTNESNRLFSIKFCYKSVLAILTLKKTVYLAILILKISIFRQLNNH